jgi:hypothetical protein
MKHQAAIAVAITVALIVATATAIIYVAQLPSSNYPSSSCAALKITRNSVAGSNEINTYVCGSGTVADPDLRMTLNNYYFVDGRSIQGLTSGVYLLANITIANIGTGNTSIGPTLYVNASDGSTPTGNSEEGVDVTFPNTYPNASVPAQGGAFLPPGAARTYWYIFYMPGATVTDIPHMTLSLVSMFELQYGGDWEGGGSFKCIPVACGDPATDLVIATSSSTPNITPTNAT